MTPEHLVAFASAGKWLSGGSESRRDSITPPTLSSTRMHSILDAMASLCVSAGKGEIYAVGLQLSDDGGPNGTITLTIAGNKGVNEKVSEHLHAIWMKLQLIAKSCHEYYKVRGVTYPMDYANESPPSKAALEDASEVRLHLTLDVYRYSLRKFVARLNKHYNAFMAFAEMLNEYWLDQPETNNDHKKNFQEATDFVRFIRFLVRQDEINYSDLVTMVKGLWLLVRSLRKSKCLASWSAGVAQSRCLYNSDEEPN